MGENGRYEVGKFYPLKEIQENFVDLHEKVTIDNVRYSVFGKKDDGDLRYLFMPRVNVYWFYGTKTKSSIERILQTLIKHPELVLIPLAVLFPSMANIPVIKMLMARRFAL